MINKVILIGNVGADPEVRVLESGTKVARLRVATTERIYNRQTQERRDHTEWHTVTLWSGLADVADKYVRKGSQVYIEGKIRSREWEDPTTHTKRYGFEILADTMNMLGRRENAADGGGSAPSNGWGQQNAAQSQPARPAAQPSADLEPLDDPDDLPF